MEALNKGRRYEVAPTFIYLRSNQKKLKALQSNAFNFFWFCLRDNCCSLIEWQKYSENFAIIGGDTGMHSHGEFAS